MEKFFLFGEKVTEAAATFRYNEVKAKETYI